MEGSENQRPEAVLVVNDLTAGYGGVAILSDVCISVGEGEIVTVVGPNGAGKSTMLKAIMGLLSPMGGEVRLAGKTISHRTTERVVAEGVGYVPQEREVFEPLSVRENLEMGGYLLKGSDIPGRIEEVSVVFPTLRRFLTQTAGKLSGGERKMVGIARALMNHPHLLILDEPTSGLSAQVASNVFEEHITRLSSAGVAVLMVEQKALAALEVSDWSYVLVGGKITRSSSPAELLDEGNLGRAFLEGAASDRR